MKRPAHENLARQWRVLLALQEKPRGVGQLARRFKVSKSTIERDIACLARVFIVEPQRVETHKQMRAYTARMEVRRG